MLEGADLRKVARAYANYREAPGDDIDIAAHCTGQFDAPSAIGLCRAIEPIQSRWIEDPLSVSYFENALGAMRGFKEKMAAGKQPVVRKGAMALPEGPGLGLQLNEDWLREHAVKGEAYWS